jgi:hypothetical protein
LQVLVTLALVVEDVLELALVVEQLAEVQVVEQ